MTAPKFTHRDRMRVASEQLAALILAANDPGRRFIEGFEAEAVVRADKLLTELATTPAPACVDSDIPSPEALLGSLVTELERGLHSLSNAVDQIASKTP